MSVGERVCPHMHMVPELAEKECMATGDVIQADTALCGMDVGIAGDGHNELITTKPDIQVAHCLHSYDSRKRSLRVRNKF